MVIAHRGRAAGEGAVIPFLPGCGYCAVNCDGGVCASFPFACLRDRGLIAGWHPEVEQRPPRSRDRTMRESDDPNNCRTIPLS